MISSPHLSNFSSQDPEKVLWEIYRIRQRILAGEKIDMPLITLLLFPEGNRVVGYFVDMKSEGQQHHAAIDLAGPTGPSGELFFVYIGAIRGISVQDISRLEHILTEVTAKTKLAVMPTTSRLIIRKKLEDEMKSLAEFTGATLPLEMKGELPSDVMHLYVISNLITDAVMTLKRIATTDIGKSAVKQLQSVQFDFQPTQEDCLITNQNNHLVLTGNFERSFTTSLRRKELYEKVEAVL